MEIINFILGCIIIAVIVTIGLFFLRIAFGIVILTLSMFFSFIAWIVDTVRGK